MNPAWFWGVADFTTKWMMNLRSPTKNETALLDVMLSESEVSAFPMVGKSRCFGCASE
jgi:hypothetical protein